MNPFLRSVLVSMAVGSIMTILDEGIRTLVRERIRKTRLVNPVPSNPAL